MTAPKILYKYVNEEGFKRIWDSEKIRFTQLSQLNDPYENRIFDPNIDMKIHELSKLSNNNKRSTFALLHGEKHTIDKQFKDIQNEIDNRFGILSLTRNPANLLMWSHYANEHKGVVIGIDVSNPIFNKSGVIRNPDEGNVVYSSIKPRNFKPFEIKRQKQEKGDGYTFILEPNDQIHIDFVLLYKSIDWAYEEEVRIVRDFYIEKGEIKLVDNKEIALFPLPKSAIKYVIFGERYDKKMSEEFISENMELNKYKIDFIQASIDDYQYRIRFTHLNKVVKTQKKQELKSPDIKGQMLTGKNNRKKRKKK